MPGEPRPCPHMVSAVNQIAEGRKGGLYLWYALRHLVKCPRCQAALAAIRSYLGQVSLLRARKGAGLDDDRWAAIESIVASEDGGQG